MEETPLMSQDKAVERVTFSEYPLYKYRAQDGKHLTRKELRVAMLAQFKYCYWCGVLCRDYVVQDGEEQPKDMGTVDHLVSRHFRKKGELCGKVLACFRCNDKRSRKPQPPNVLL